MTEGLFPPAMLELLKPEAVVPAMLVLAHESAPNRTIVGAGAGTFTAAHIAMTPGVHLGLGDDVPEQLAARLPTFASLDGASVPGSGADQGRQELTLAMAGKGA
jgi:hypothetical protein